MASLKEVRNRITSVNSTQQITKAMKMVSAAKLRKAQEAITQLRPYSQKLSEMIAAVSANTELGSQSPFTAVRPIEKVLLIVVTSDRGLCGAFNANVAKAAMLIANEKYPSQLAKGNVSVMPIGKKGGEVLARRGYTLDSNFVDTFQGLNFSKVKTAAENVMEGFVAGDFDEVQIMFNESLNVATQVIRTEQFLPISNKIETKATAKVDYAFEPSEDEIIQELLPKALKIQFYKAVLESNSSEHGARMTAMDKATENAGDLLKALKLEYNRSRQAAITTEILEIVGGAEALKNK